MDYDDQQTVKLSTLESDLRDAKITPISGATIIFAAAQKGMKVSESERGSFKCHTISGTDATALYAHFKTESEKRAQETEKAQREKPATRGQLSDLVEVANLNTKNTLKLLNEHRNQLIEMTHIVNFICVKFDIDPHKVLAEAGA